MSVGHSMSYLFLISVSGIRTQPALPNNFRPPDVSKHILLQISNLFHNLLFQTKNQNVTHQYVLQVKEALKIKDLHLLNVKDYSYEYFVGLSEIP